MVFGRCPQIQKSPNTAVCLTIFEDKKVSKILQILWNSGLQWIGVNRGRAWTRPLHLYRRSRHVWPGNVKNWRKIDDFGLVCFSRVCVCVVLRRVLAVLGLGPEFS